MADKEMKSTMIEFGANDQADYYSGITSIMVNGKNAYEPKGKFLDDLHMNSFSGTNGKDAVEHIKYFLKIVDPIDLPNVNQDKLGVVVFPISLAGDAWRWFNGIKGSITSWVDLTAKFFGKYYPPSRTGKVNTPIIKALWYYWKLGSNGIEQTNEETSDLKETNHDDEQEISEIFRIETNLFDYETPLCEKFKEFNYLLKIDPDLLTKDIEGFKTYDEYKDDWIYEWNENVPWDSELKDEALRNKAIMEGLIDEDDESSNNDKERCELFDDHELPVCNIRRFEMIKYSFGDDEEYVVVKEDEYDDLTSISKDVCRAYQEIFCMMDEG
ncbi:hypothetical protein Tco_0514758 [Tanacetum coccineum]